MTIFTPQPKPPKRKKQNKIGMLDNFVEDIIAERTNNAKKLAKKFPELKGLSWEQFLEKLSIELDFITSNEMFEEINKK